MPHIRDASGYVPRKKTGCDFQRMEAAMFGVVLIVAIEAAVLLAFWRWDERMRGVELRRRRLRFLRLNPRHGAGAQAAPSASLPGARDWPPGLTRP